MRASPAILRIVIALALAGAGRASGDVSVGGSATFGYARQDTAAWNGESASADSYDWGLALSLGGTPFRPGLLSWSALGSYSQERSVYGGTTAGRDGLGYGLSLSLLDSNPLGLSFSATRTRAEFTQGGSAVSGSTVAGLESAGLVLAFPNVPRLTAQLTHTDLTSHGFGGDETTSETLRLRTTAADHVGPLHYAMEYNTGWSSGTFIENNYHDHSLALSGQASMNDTLVSFSGTYLLRLPTVESPLNPRFDDDALSGAIRWQWNEKLLPSVSYSYARALISAPDTPAREGLSHGLTQSLEYRYRPNLRFTQSLVLSYSEQRVGSDQVQAAAESLGGAVAWFVPVFPNAASAYTLSLAGGASTGLVQGGGLDRATGYSLNGTAALNRSTGSGSAQAAYSVSWADSLAVGGAQRFAHEIRLDTDTAQWSRLQLRLSLVGQSARQTSPLLGTSASRSISGTASALWDQYNAVLTAGLSEGLAPGMRDLGLADGLVWAPAYDTHQQFARALGGARFGRLTLTGTVSWVHSDGLGRPDSQEVGLSAALGYSLGLFTLTLQDSYSTATIAGVSQSGNLFMLRLTRSFGWSF